MPRHKAGLHKEISSIFIGVPVHRDRDTAGQPGAPASEAPKPTFSKLPVLDRYHLGLGSKQGVDHL